MTPHWTPLEFPFVPYKYIENNLKPSKNIFRGELKRIIGQLLEAKIGWIQRAVYFLIYLLQKCIFTQKMHGFWHKKY